MNRIPITNRVDLLMEACRGRHVLHLGCTNYPYTKESLAEGSLLHGKLAEISESISGFDNDTFSLELMRDAGFDHLYEADLERLAETEFNKSVDVIVAGEMIEHLSNPGLFLEGIKRFMSDETELLITTINAYSALRFVQYALRGKGGVNEPVHPDHVAYYSYRTLNLLLERHGFQCDNFMFYGVGPEHRPYVKWFYLAFNDVCTKLWRQTSDGVIARCRLKKN